MSEFYYISIDNLLKGHRDIGHALNNILGHIVTLQTTLIYF